MVEKTRNSLRAAEGDYDIVNINSAGMAEQYASRLPASRSRRSIPTSSSPEGVLDFGGSAYWNFETQSFDPNGTFLGLPTNGNVQVLYYRTDLYEAKGLKVPETWDELLANAKALNNPPNAYGFVPAGARRSILYNWTPYLFSYGGSFFADPAKGDYSVTLASPEALKALEMYITLGKEAGPENFGAIAQAELASFSRPARQRRRSRWSRSTRTLQDLNSRSSSARSAPRCCRPGRAASIPRRQDTGWPGSPATCPRRTRRPHSTS